MGKEVYFIGQIDVKDFEAYMAEYGMTVAEQLIKAGVEVLVGSPDAEVLEGEWPGCWTILLRFPSIEVAKSWYDSEEYEPFKQLRIEKLTNFSNVALLPAFDPASIGL